jgi:hypothetical protein
VKCHACDVHTDEDRCFVCGDLLDDPRSYWATNTFRWRPGDLTLDSITL